MPIHAPFYGGFWGTFPPNDVTHRPNPKKDYPWLNHVIWAINRENRSRGSTWALVREKKDRTGQEKVTYLWRSPHWSDVHENLCSGWCTRRNHVCQVSKWNFQGLRFYRGSNFPFFLWALQQCSATALPVIVYAILCSQETTQRTLNNKRKEKYNAN